MTFLLIVIKFYVWIISLYLSRHLEDQVALTAVESPLSFIIPVTQACHPHEDHQPPHSHPQQIRGTRGRGAAISLPYHSVGGYPRGQKCE